ERMSIPRLRPRRPRDAQERSFPAVRRSRLAQRPVHLGEAEVKVGMGIDRDALEKARGTSPVAAAVGQIGKSLERGPVTGLDPQGALIQRSRGRLALAGVLDLRQLRQAPGDCL